MLLNVVFLLELHSLQSRSFEVRLKGADIDVIDDGRGIPQSERDMVRRAMRSVYFVVA